MRFNCMWAIKGNSAISALQDRPQVTASPGLLCQPSVVTTLAHPPTQKIMSVSSCQLSQFLQSALHTAQATRNGGVGFVLVVM